MFPVSLKATHIKKTFEDGWILKKQTRIIQGISFEVRKGETLGIMGESGAGKTTLAKIIAGLEKPTEGEVLFEDRNIFSMKRKEFLFFRRKVQLVFQNPESSLNPRKTIKKSFQQVLNLLDIPRPERMEAVLNVLRMVGLSEEILCRYPHQLSGGQNQRVVLGRVLLIEPEIIILDEPTSGLDISVQAQILHLLRSIQAKQGMSYILISHDKDIIRFMSHRIGAIMEGKLFYL